MRALCPAGRRLSAVRHGGSPWVRFSRSRPVSDPYRLSTYPMVLSWASVSSLGGRGRSPFRSLNQSDPTTGPMSQAAMLSLNNGSSKAARWWPWQ